jgi:putative selenate reductase molybdopterin-binding subunit
MDIHLTINGQNKTLSCQPQETLFRVLRREGFHSIRFASESGETGAAAILLDGELISADIMLAAQADGHVIETVEGLAKGLDLHPLQRAFIENGAIQSGYSTPAMILAAKGLLDKNPDPSEEEIRDALSGILDRETGYVKPVQAILIAAAIMRGDDPEISPPNVLTPIVYTPGIEDESMTDDFGGRPTAEFDISGIATKPLPQTKLTSRIPETKVVGKSEPNVDAIKLA